MLAIVLAAITSQFTIQRAEAECLRTDRWPAFTTIAPGAKVIVLGRVSETIAFPIDGQTSSFRVDVVAVLRGDAPASFTVEDGTQFAEVMEVCEESRLWARVGDVLAFALAARPAPSIDRVMTVAWVDGRPAHEFMLGAQVLSERQVRAIAELPQTDAADGAPDASRDHEGTGWLLIIAGLVGAMGFVLRRPRSPIPSRRGP